MSKAVQKQMLKDESECEGGSIAETLESILQGKILFQSIHLNLFFTMWRGLSLCVSGSFSEY